MKLWNSYTSTEVLKLKIPTLEFHDLAFACPPSGEIDRVHYERFVFLLAEEKLMSYVLNDLSQE